MIRTVARIEYLFGWNICRVYFAAARDGLFPQIFSLIQTKFVTPWISVWMTVSMQIYTNIQIYMSMQIYIKHRGVARHRDGIIVIYTTYGDKQFIHNVIS